MDTQLRSVVKSITWRVIATAMTMAFSYIWLRDLSSSLVLAISVNFVKTFIYYIHERSWNTLKWGRISPSNEESPATVDGYNIEAQAHATTLGD